MGQDSLSRVVRNHENHDTLGGNLSWLSSLRLTVTVSSSSLFLQLPSILASLCSWSGPQFKVSLKEELQTPASSPTGTKSTLCACLFSHVTLFSYLWNILQMSHFNLPILKNTLRIYKCTVNELAPIKYFKYLRQLRWSIFLRFYFFLRWTIFKWSSFKSSSTTLLLFHGLSFFFFDPTACGILATQPGIEPTAPALEGEV